MPPRPVTCLLVPLFLFMSCYYLRHCSFSPWYSYSGNWTKRFLLIVCTVMLQNYYEGKIVKLYIRERLFVERMHQKKTNSETLCKIWFVSFVPWLSSSMSRVFYDYHIMYIYIYIIYILFIIYICIYTYKFTNKCHSQTTPFSVWRWPGSESVHIFRADWMFLKNMEVLIQVSLEAFWHSYTCKRKLQFFINKYNFQVSWHDMDFKHALEILFDK